MLKKIILLVILFVMLSCEESTEKDIKAHLNYYLIGISQYKARDYNNAIISFKKDYLKTKNLENLFKLSKISIETGDPHNAEVYLKKILKKENNNRAKFQLALLYKKMGRYNKSIKYFSKLLNDKSYLDDSYYHIIDIYVYMGLTKEALNLFNSDINKIKKKYKIEYIFITHFYKNDKENYDKYYSDLLNHSKNYKILNKLVDFFIFKNDIKRVSEVLSKLEKYYPKDAKVASLIGQVYLRNGDFDNANKYFEKSESYDHRNLLNKINLATSEIYNNNLDKAENYLKEAIGIKSNSIKSLLLIGFIYYLKGDSNKSDKIIKTVKENTLESEIKSYRASNQLIDIYFINLNMDKNNKFPNKDKIINFIVGKNIKLLYLKVKLLNEMGLYKEVTKLEDSKFNDSSLIKEFLIANIFLKNKKSAYKLLNRLGEKKEIYKIWLDYSFKKTCDNLDSKYKKYKKYKIFIDIYTNCLIKERRFKLSKKIIKEFINNNKISNSTMDYLKKKIIVINYNLIQQQ